MKSLTNRLDGGGRRRPDQDDVLLRSMFFAGLEPAARARLLRDATTAVRGQ